MCIFPHSWIPDIQFGVIIYTFRKQRDKDWKKWGERSRWLFQNMYGGLIAQNLWRMRKKNTSFKEHTQKVSPKECILSPVGIIIIWL